MSEPGSPAVPSRDPAARGAGVPVGSGGAVAPLRQLGRFRLVTVGINSVIGGGIFIPPAEAAGLIGPASLVAYLVAGSPT